MLFFVAVVGVGIFCDVAFVAVASEGIVFTFAVNVVVVGGGGSVVIAAVSFISINKFF